MTERPLTPHAVPALHVTTVANATSEPPLAAAESDNPLLFQRLGKGVAGSGVALRAEFSGTNRFHDATTWWSEVVEHATVTNPLGRPGTGLLAMGAFSFSTLSHHRSVLIVPRHVWGTDEHGSWQTTIEVIEHETGGAAVEEDGLATSHAAATNALDNTANKSSRATEPESAAEPAARHNEWHAGQVSEARFLDLVSQAKQAISQGGLHKVVVARDLVRSFEQEPDWRIVLQGLTEAYPDTFVFSLDGFFGASPETLVSLRGEHVSLRVLAGSTARGSHPEEDRAQSEALSTSTKDLDEHQFAVRSVVESLAAANITAVADDNPFSLKLPNLWHLATDVVAKVPEGIGGLRVLQALHPTAAVAGSPTTDALAFLEEHENLDRGRYAGPVGWIDERGDGDWAIALRCAQYDPEAYTLTAYAGAGVVAESDPERELLETGLKFRPITEGAHHNSRP
ncbi:isochorismate synthase [Pontimonas salivibrio]|uniref:isochorismate synthase n=1 Tax=Pontimonas salivibrio TaxID=1159327 RepID=UPI001319F21C|nr:chorismate-binding protein [Pontimonas salivibrio]